MRVSSLIYSTSGLAGMQHQQAAIAKLNVQIATGQRLLSPKDDPVAATRVLQLTDRIAVRHQYLSNQINAGLALDYERTVVEGMRKVLENTRNLLFGTGPTQEEDLRNQYADLVSAAYNQLKDLANTRDPSGNYIFSGFETGTQPFTHTQVAPDTDANPLTHAVSGATTYNGTPQPGGLRYVEIDSGRTLQVNDNLDSVFQAGTASDLLQALDQVAIDLREDPATLLSQADIDAAVTAIDTALDGLGAIERRLAAAKLELEDVRKSTQALLNEEQNALGAIQELDQAAAIIELQRRQTTLEAAQRAYARTSELSLFNYL